jgi:hypothetical protein
MQFYLYIYWAFITPFGVIYPGSPTPGVEGAGMA